MRKYVFDQFVCKGCNITYPSSSYGKKLLCKQCYEPVRLEKQRLRDIIKQQKKALRRAEKDRAFRTCKSCGLIKERILFRNRGHGRKDWVDECGKHWHGRTCPECVSIKRSVKKYKEYQCHTCDIIFESVLHKKYCSTKCKPIYKKKPRPKQKCLTCNKPFTRKGKQIYCSRECKPLKEKITKVYNKICETCGKQFIAHRNNAKFCKQSHQTAQWRYLKERKHILKYKQNISKPFKKEIISIYDNRPDGYVVDHIIPLKHELFCGLHVPWNLQYLTVEENNIKSNKWDGTYDNKSWRKK